MHQWISGLLANRSQQVIVEEQVFSVGKVISSVPQNLSLAQLCSSFTKLHQQPEPQHLVHNERLIPEEATPTVPV